MSDPTPAPAPAEPTPTPAPAPTPEPAPQPTPAPQDGRTPLDSLPQDVQDYIKSLRGEARTYREERDAFKGQIDTLTPAQQTLEQLRATLTGEGGQKPATPEELQAQIQAQQTAAQQAQADAAAAQRQVAVMRIAALPDVNANANRLLDSVSFMQQVAALPNADEASIRQLVEQAVQTDQTLRVIPLAAGSGGATHGGQRPSTGRRSLNDAIGAHYQQNPAGNAR